MLRESDPAVLVTGATGFIGRHLVTRLLVAGRRVVVLARRRAGLTGEERVGEIFGELPGNRSMWWKQISQILLCYGARSRALEQPLIR